MAATSAYNVETIQLLMTQALGVGLADTTSDPVANTVSCPSKGVTVTCTSEGADDLMVLAGQRWTAVDQAYQSALSTRDLAFDQSQRAQGIRASMTEAEASAIAEAQAAAVAQPPDEAA